MKLQRWRIDTRWRFFTLIPRRTKYWSGYIWNIDWLWWTLVLDFRTEEKFIKDMFGLKESNNE